MIQDGRYSLVYNNGEYRTLQIEKQKEGDLAGKVIVSLKIGPGTSWRDYQGCGFLSDDNKVSFWKKFRTSNSPERLARIQQAVDRIARNPKEAGMAFAMQSKRCCRCNRELTVPASIHGGMGPDCAEKYAWEKTDQVAVHDHLAATRQLDTNFANAASPNQEDGSDEWMNQYSFAAEQVARGADPNNSSELFFTEQECDEFIASKQRPQVPSAPRTSTNILPAKLQEKAAKALVKSQADNKIARMIAFKKANDPKAFYDPFGVEETLSEAAAVNFWARRFQTAPLDDPKFLEQEKIA